MSCFSLKHPFSHLIILVFLFHVMVAATLTANGLPVCYVPHHMAELSLLLIIAAPVFISLFYLFGSLCHDGIIKYYGHDSRPLNNRLKMAVKLYAGLVVLAIVYIIVLIAYHNLKAAIPFVNPISYDVVLEEFERKAFGGVLPTEYLARNIGYLGMYVWNLIYSLFGLFMLVSVLIAFHYKGFFGASLLTLAFTIGLLCCITIACFIPTLGPIFTHQNWFIHCGNLANMQGAAFLEHTVEKYAKNPGTVYFCSGIAAMPSYHVYASVCGIFAWKFMPLPMRCIGIVFILLTWVSTFILGWHYVMDGLIGILLGIVIMHSLIYLFVRRSVPSINHP